MESLDSRFLQDKFFMSQKHFSIGEKYNLFDEQGNMLFFVEREKFKMRANIHIYESEAKTRELLLIEDKSIMDWNATMDVKDPASGQIIGSFKRDGIASIIRRTWKILDSTGNILGSAAEDSLFKALFRRFLGLLKTDFVVEINGSEVGRFSRKISFGDKYVFDLSGDPEKKFDRRLAVALAVLLDSAEGR